MKSAIANPLQTAFICKKCNSQIKSGMILVGEDYDVEQLSANTYQIKCLTCSIVDLVGCWMSDSYPYDGSQYEMRSVIKDGIVELLRNDAKDEIKTLIKESIKEIMKEEAADPNGAFSP